MVFRGCGFHPGLAVGKPPMVVIAVQGAFFLLIVLENVSENRSAPRTEVGVASANANERRFVCDSNLIISGATPSELISGSVRASYACAFEAQYPLAYAPDHQSRQSPYFLRCQQQRQPISIPVQFESHTSSDIPPALMRVSERSEGALCESHREFSGCPQLTPTSDTTDYELVRIYHPDSPVARVYPPEISEARFHAISASYDVLRGRRVAMDPESPGVAPRPRFDLHALWRAKQRHRRDPIGPVDDRWKDGVILGSLILVRSSRSSTCSD